MADQEVPTVRRKRWRRIAVVFLIVCVVPAGHYGYSSVRRSIEAKPARDAVLAIKADLSRTPLPDDQRSAVPDEAPNIVIVLADDMGWRDVGYNKSEIRTPVMDRLSEQGIRLNRFYVQPSCSPTRAALMTGKAPMRLGILAPLSKNNPKGLPLNETTLAERLKAAGYQTALTGKWHLGARNPDYHPNTRGFDLFYGHVTGGIGYYDKVHGGGYDWQRNGETVREKGYSTRLIAQEAIRFIRKRDSSRPFFLYAAFNAPHLPNEAPRETLASYAHLPDSKRQLHAAMVTELDTAIGQIHETLVAEGIEKNTIVWFMSDNGGLIPKNPVRYAPEPLFSMAIESRLGIRSNPTFADFVSTNLSDGGADNRPFKDGKQSVAEGGVRVPAFMYWPDTLSPASFNYMATVQDVVPTLMEVCGIDPVDTSFDGRSIWTALNTNTPAIAKEYIVQTSVLIESAAVYRYPFKLIDHGSGSRTLYNVESDPLESHDIAAAEPELVAELSEWLADFPRGENVALPLQTIVDDTDYFGGVEDREPWADQPFNAESSASY